MKQAVRKIQYILMFTLFLAVMIPMWTHAEDILSVQVNGQDVGKKITAAQGSTIKLSVFYNETKIKPKKAKYQSGKPKVATVSKKGVIKTLKAGKSKITVSYLGKTVKFKVVVTEAKAADAAGTGAGSVNTGTDTGTVSSGTETGDKASGTETGDKAAGTGTADPSASAKVSSPAKAGKLTCSKGNKIKTGETVTLKFNKKARQHDWTWTFTGTCGKDVHILKPKYKKTGKLVFTVWPTGGTLTITGTDPAGLTIRYSFKVSQSKKWKKRENYRTQALAGLTPGMTQKQMVVYFADYIADHSKYGPGQGNFFRVIDKGVGDCWCYSTAFKFLADAVGIETIIVKNALKTSHYWNQVKINDVWYNVDVQGYDTGKSHHWILSSDKKHGSRWRGDPNFSARHGINYPVSPAHTCTKTLKFKSAKTKTAQETAA